MTVDIHAHLYHPEWYPMPFQRYLARSYADARKRHASDNAKELQDLNTLLQDPNGEITIGNMDKAGVDKKVIAILDFGLELGEPLKSIIEIHKEILGICARQNGRLIGFAGIDPRRPEAERVIRAAFDELGARGLKLHPTSESWTLLDDRVITLATLAQERGFPILVHTGATIEILSSKYSTVGQIVEFAKRMGQAYVIAGHSAYASWKRFTEIEPLPENLYFDISDWQKRRRSEGDLLREDIVHILRTFQGRVFYGSDGPFTSYNIAILESDWIKFVRDCAREAAPDLERAVFTPRILQ